MYVNNSQISNRQSFGSFYINNGAERFVEKTGCYRLVGKAYVKQLNNEATDTFLTVRPSCVGYETFDYEKKSPLNVVLSMIDRDSHEEITAVKVGRMDPNGNVIFHKKLDILESYFDKFNDIATEYENLRLDRKV